MLKAMSQKRAFELSHWNIRSSELFKLFIWRRCTYEDAHLSYFEADVLAASSYASCLSWTMDGGGGGVAIPFLGGCSLTQRFLTSWRGFAVLRQKNGFLSNLSIWGFGSLGAFSGRWGRKVYRSPRQDRITLILIITYSSAGVWTTGAIDAFMQSLHVRFGWDRGHVPHLVGTFHHVERGKSELHT